jgi:hypothetical protein
LKAVRSDGEHRRLKLSERILDENLGGYRHVPQPCERLRRVTGDAKIPESRSVGLDEPHREDAAAQAPLDDRGIRRRQFPTSGRGPDQHRASSRQNDAYEQELMDVAWLYAWSHKALPASPRAPDRKACRGRVSRLRARQG